MNMTPTLEDPSAVAALRPSEYTAALIQVIRANAELIRGAHALEMGCGSAVVLAVAGALGAASLCGIDIEDVAISTGSRLLHQLGLDERAEFHQGNMWQPVVNRRFDLIAANLPHFPMEQSQIPGRLPSWSAGGSDGRLLLDPFLEGLVDHLAPGGRAIITHNAFVDIGRSREIALRHGLSLQIAMTSLVYVPQEKLHHMTDRVLSAEEGRSIFRSGPYAFAEMHIVEIGTPDALA